MAIFMVRPPSVVPKLASMPISLYYVSGLSVPKAILKGSGEARQDERGVIPAEWLLTLFPHSAAVIISYLAMRGYQESLEALISQIRDRAS